MASSARQDDSESPGVEETQGNACLECPGACCSFRAINISYRALKSGQRYDSMLIDGLGEDGHTYQLLFEDGEVPEMEWYIIEWHDGRRVLAFHCTHEEGGMCTEYERRPEMCRDFECAALRGEVDLEEFLDDHGHDYDPEADPDVEIREVTERVREIIGRAEL